MNVARSYEARCDLAQGQQEAAWIASDNWQRQVDDTIDQMTNVDHQERSRKAITEALDEHTDPAELQPLLADLYLALKAEQLGRADGRELARNALAVLDQFIYDKVSQEAQEEVTRRYA